MDAVPLVAATIFSLPSDVLWTIQQFTCINALLNTSSHFRAHKRNLFQWRLCTSVSNQYVSTVAFRTRLHGLMAAPRNQLHVFAADEEILGVGECSGQCAHIEFKVAVVESLAPVSHIGFKFL